MHMIIAAIVYAENKEDAAAQGKDIFKELVGTEENSGEFDYYQMFEEDGLEIAGRDRWGNYPRAAKATSPVMLKLVGQLWDNYSKERKEYLGYIREELKTKTDEQILVSRYSSMFGYYCYMLGSYKGHAIPLYDSEGNGITDIRVLQYIYEGKPSELERAYVVPADVHY
jgi:hypothetical protein